MRIARDPAAGVPARPRAVHWKVACPAGALVLTFAMLAGCAKKAPPPPPAPLAVKVITLTPQTVSLTTDLPGRTVPYKVAEIRPQVSGVIQKRMFVEGSDVKEGQQLYQIDPSLYQAAYDSAAATAESSRLQVERYKPLAEINAVSKQDYDNAVAAAAQNKAAADTAHINLVYTRLLSPISGRIGRSAVTEGALVTANQTTALATVQQLDPIYVDVTQPSAVLLRLKRELAAGELVRTGGNEAEVHLMLEDGSRYKIPGKMQFAEVQVDPTTGSVTLRALFPNPDKLLLPGMFVREQIEEGRRTDALLVPQVAVTHNQRGDATALVVNEENKVELHTLTTERAIDDKWLVTEGLKAGDRVIVEGLQYAKPGAAVKPEEQQSPGTPRGAGGAGAAPAP
ncbi:MAG TPA: efflux RND transporter periplasmic adaptor subunit [Steroidobacteraceae bacterium]